MEFWPLIFWTLQMVIGIFSIMSERTVHPIFPLIAFVICFLAFVDYIEDDDLTRSNLLMFYYWFMLFVFGTLATICFLCLISRTNMNPYIYFVSTVFCIAIYMRKITKKYNLKIRLPRSFFKHIYDGFCNLKKFFCDFYVAFFVE